jgi:hypothetical protein
VIHRVIHRFTTVDTFGTIHTMISRAALVLLLALAGCNADRGLPTGPSDGAAPPQDQAGRLGTPCTCVSQDPDGRYLPEPCVNPYTGCADGYLCGLPDAKTLGCTPLCSFAADGGTHCPTGYTCRGGIIAGNDYPKTACMPE